MDLNVGPKNREYPTHPAQRTSHHIASRLDNSFHPASRGSEHLPHLPFQLLLQLLHIYPTASTRDCAIVLPFMQDHPRHMLEASLRMCRWMQALSNFAGERGRGRGKECFLTSSSAPTASSRIRELPTTNPASETLILRPPPVPFLA